MVGSTLVVTRRSRAPWALVAAGVLVLGACGDDSGSEDDDAGAGEDKAVSVDSAFCADVEEAQALGDLGDVDAVGGDEAAEAEAMEGLQDMHQGLLDLEVPDEVADDWDLFFSSAVTYFESIADFQEAFTAEAETLDESQVEDLDLEGLEDLEDLDMGVSEDMQLMDDETVIEAQSAVNEFLQENCEITI